jgi:hypothetical protein
VKRDGKWGCVDTTGKEVFPCEYDDIRWTIGEETIIVIVKKGTFCYLLSLPNPKRDEKRDSKNVSLLSK